MRRIKYFATGIWVDKHLGQWITSIVIMVHFALGISIIVGGVDRFSPPSYNPLIYYTSGNTWIWGVWISFSAVLTGTPFRWPNILGLWLGMFWHIVWMASFATAVLRYETAAATPIPMYGGMAMICAALLTARVIDKSGDDVLDPNTQTAIASVFTAIIATSGVVAVALINNRKERGKAANAGVEAGLSDREVLKLVGELTAENARKEFTIQSLRNTVDELEDEVARLTGLINAKEDTS